MRAYWAVGSARCRELLQYRAAAAAGIATQVFWGFIRLMIFGAFYASSTVEPPMSLAEVTTFVWLGQALFRALPFGVDLDVREKIRTGTVAYELVRPLDIYSLWFARSAAFRIAPTLLRALPMLPIAVFFGLGAPPSAASGIAFAASLVAALTLSSAISVLLNTSLLWTVSGEGIARIVPSIMFLASGSIVPLPLFPDWTQPILKALPFRGIVDVPFRIYSGNISAASAVGEIAGQFLWCAALILAGRWALARGLRRVVVQGG